MVLVHFSTLMVVSSMPGMLPMADDASRSAMGDRGMAAMEAPEDAAAIAVAPATMDGIASAGALASGGDMSAQDALSDPRVGGVMSERSEEGVRPEGVEAAASPGPPPGVDFDSSESRNQLGVEM